MINEITNVAVLKDGDMIYISTETDGIEYDINSDAWTNLLQEAHITNVEDETLTLTMNLQTELTLTGEALDSFITQLESPQETQEGKG